MIIHFVINLIDLNLKEPLINIFKTLVILTIHDDDKFTAFHLKIIYKQKHHPYHLYGALRPILIFHAM